MKKLICAVLTVSLLLTCCVTAVFASKFTDLNDSKWDWARTAVDEMTEQGLIAGYNDTTFGPADGVTTLQAMLFMSRIIGFYEEENAEVLALANSYYDQALSDYALGNNRSEIALLLYYGVFTEKELKTYLAPSKINQPLKRHEAAIFLTKTAGAEKKLADKSLNFKDAANIPTSSKKYVGYVVEQGFMVGMSDTEFAPNEQVNRAQMAAMLYRVINKLNVNYVKGTVTALNGSNLNVKPSETLSAKTYAIPDEAEIRINGVEAELSEIEKGDLVMLKFFEGKVAYVEVFAEEYDAVETGYVAAKKSGSTPSLEVITEGETEPETFYLDSDCTVLYDGAESSFAKILVGDNVTLYLTDDAVCKAEVDKRPTSVKYVEFAGVIYEPSAAIAVTDREGNQKTYLLSEKVSVRKNNRGTDLKSLLVGDSLTLTLKDNQVTEVLATSTAGTVSGTIDSIMLSSSPYIILKEGSSLNQYAFSNTTSIFLDGKPGSIYDLRPGYTVELQLESNTVISLTSKAIQTNNTIMGTVESVNGNYGFLYLNVLDLETGETNRMQIFTKKNNGTKVLDNKNNNNSRAIKEILKGESVLVTGTTQTDGTFEAATIIILAD